MSSEWWWVLCMSDGWWVVSGEWWVMCDSGMSDDCVCCEWCVVNCERVFYFVIILLHTNLFQRVVRWALYHRVLWQTDTLQSLSRVGRCAHRCKGIDNCNREGLRYTVTPSRSLCQPSAVGCPFSYSYTASG